MTKIHFCTPCYGGQITEVCFSSYLQWTIMGLQNNVNFVIDTLANESNINRGRNTCAAKFLAGDATHLMFVDADIGWNPVDVVKLIQHNKDVVGGVYPQKSIPVKHVVNTIDNGEKEGDLVEVGTIGTGFMLIKRTVFNQMINAGAQKYTDDIGLSEAENNNQYDFYNCTIDSEGRYLSEDWSFCRQWRKLGGKIWADLSIPLTHTGYHKFEPNLSTITEKNS